GVRATGRSHSDGCGSRHHQPWDLSRLPVGAGVDSRKAVGTTTPGVVSRLRVALARRPPQDLGRDPAADQPPGARVADEAAPLDDDPAAEDRGHGPALDRPALPRAVVAHVKILARERLTDRRIDEDEVRVAPGRDDTLLRIEPENPRRVPRRHRGEPTARTPSM